MKIKALYLTTGNLAATIDFYTTVLQIPVGQKQENQVTFYLGTTLLQFTLVPDSNPVYHIALDIPHNQLLEAYAWLQPRTAILPVSPESDFSEFTLWNAKSFYFYDNNGNLLEYIARFDSATASTQPFDSTAIVAISEIGIVTHDVPKLAQQLMERYPLEVYTKQPAAENFTALGDETGLLILVKDNRNWFPTDTVAVAFPLTVVFDDGDSHEQRLEIE